MSKATPGPWNPQFGGGPGDEGFSIHSKNVAAKIGVVAECWPARLEPEQRGELSANARLISAAPDLLEALKGVLRIADRATVEFDAARAAIAKAEVEAK